MLLKGAAEKASETFGRFGGLADLFDERSRLFDHVRGDAHVSLVLLDRKAVRGFGFFQGGGHVPRLLHRNGAIVIGMQD